MDDLFVATGHDGDYAAAVPTILAGEGYDAAFANARSVEADVVPMLFREWFETIRMTPQSIADSVVEENGGFKGLLIEGNGYRPSQRFLKSLALRMKVPLGVFELFTPLEVIRRAAERAPDLPLRLTVDREESRALALVEDRGVPLPAGNIEIIMREDPRLQEFNYRDGVITGRFDLGEARDIPGDSKYGVHISTEVPVDGMGTPATTLATWRQVCSNGAIAEAPMFRTKMEVKDNSGDHFRRLLKSFSNPRGIELLHEPIRNGYVTSCRVSGTFSTCRRSMRCSRTSIAISTGFTASATITAGAGRSRPWR